MKQKENREMFFDRLVFRVDTAQLDLIKFAYKIAKAGHGKQVRDGGERYFEHVRAVTLICIDELGVTRADVVISCLLHDMVEDTFLVDENSLKLVFGEEVAYMVMAVTKPKKDDPRYISEGHRKEAYRQQILNGTIWVKLLKLADRLHNLRTLDVCSPAKRLRKIAETRLEYVTLAESVIEDEKTLEVYKPVFRYLLKEMQKELEKLEALSAEDLSGVKA